MWVWIAGLAALFPSALPAQESLTTRAGTYLADLIRIDTTNPPGGESRAAEYLRRVVAAEGIECELLGDDPARLNFVARLESSGRRRPLLLVAHSDVVPAEAAQWKFPPFDAAVHQDILYGRGAIDDKSLLAAELAVLIELKRSRAHLVRDVILLAEADEEAGSTGIQWMVSHAWKKIDAEFALNEGGFAADLPSGTRVYHMQTAEKIPTRVLVRAHGTAGHGSLPRPDNPVVRVARALVRLAEADQPVRLNATSRRYLTEMAKLPEFDWLAELVPRLSHQSTAIAAANRIRERDPELDAQLRTTIVPTVFHAGTKINVIPSVAEAEVDARRLPNETRAEVIARMRRSVQDPTVEISAASGQEMPAVEPSSTSSALYHVMEKVFHQASPRALVLPYMQRGATDGSYLRQKGMDVYGVPLFLREDGDSRAHGTDERIALKNLEAGTELLWKVVSGIAVK